MPHYASIFTINRLRVEALLGFYEHELSTRQPVDIELRLYFAAPPAGAQDDHAGVIDYALLSEQLVHCATHRHYRLIEYLGEQLFATARNFLDERQAAEVKIWLRMTKVSPAVPHLREGASFIRSDLAVGDSVVAAS